MILVSACLLGINCKYSGDNNESEKVKEYLKDKHFVLVCPEQLGGLTTPREPAEIILKDKTGDQDKVINNKNIDVTDNFKKGAEETLKIAQIYECKEAILKEGSPSCGSSLIYDGTFSGKKIPGQGVTTALLKQNNIKVTSEKEI